MAFGLQVPLHRVADMRGHVFEVGQSVRRSRDALSVVPEEKILLTVLAATRDNNCFGACIDAVFNKLGYSLERVGLGQRDDTDGVPIIAYPQFTFIGYARFVYAFFGHKEAWIEHRTLTGWRNRLFTITGGSNPRQSSCGPRPADGIAGRLSPLSCLRSVLDPI